MLSQAQQSSMHSIFNLAKSRFPHIDLEALNPELSLSENLRVPPLIILEHHDASGSTFLNF